MLFTAAILLPLIIGLFDVKAIELRGTEGSSNEKEFTSCSRGRSYHKLSANADSRSWSYSDADTGLKGVCSAANKCGPASWSKVTALGRTVNQCAGLSQSPINLNPATIVVDDSLKYPTFSEKNGGCAQWTQFTDDHAFEVSFDETGNECENFHVTHQGEEYTLLQMHFHSPAEHTIGYGYNDAELHLVHKSDSGKYLVVGVFLDARKSSIEGSNNVFLNRLWAAAGVAGGTPTNTKDTYLAASASYETKVTNHSIPLHAYDILPASKRYYTYTGSLTTYPCSEGITFVLMKQPVLISQRDLTILRKSVALNPNTIINSYGNNNRPMHPMNSRTVRSYKGYDSE